jgi:hypothetical protein
MQLVIDEALAKANLPPPGVQLKWAGEIQVQQEEGCLSWDRRCYWPSCWCTCSDGGAVRVATDAADHHAQPAAGDDWRVAGARHHRQLAEHRLHDRHHHAEWDLVTKNAILLVDYTNTLRSRGLPRLQALLEAGPTRLRPILMTTFRHGVRHCCPLRWQSGAARSSAHRLESPSSGDYSCPRC